MNTQANSHYKHHFLWHNKIGKLSILDLELFLKDIKEEDGEVKWAKTMPINFKEVSDDCFKGRDDPWR